MNKFNIGDKVKLLVGSGYLKDYDVGTIMEIWYNGNAGYNYWVNFNINYQRVYVEEANLLPCKNNKQEEKQMNIKEKFVTAFLPEPEKSYRKTGITDGDGILTDDGSRV